MEQFYTSTFWDESFEFGLQVTTVPKSVVRRKAELWEDAPLNFEGLGAFGFLPIQAIEKEQVPSVLASLLHGAAVEQRDEEPTSYRSFAEKSRLLDIQIHTFVEQILVEGTVPFERSPMSSTSLGDIISFASLLAVGYFEHLHGPVLLIVAGGAFLVFKAVSGIGKAAENAFEKEFEPAFTPIARWFAALFLRHRERRNRFWQGVASGVYWLLGVALLGLLLFLRPEVAHSWHLKDALMSEPRAALPMPLQTIPNPATYSSEEKCLAVAIATNEKLAQQRQLNQNSKLSCEEETELTVGGDSE
jgi:hypothetical protein